MASAASAHKPPPPIVGNFYAVLYPGGQDFYYARCEKVSQRSAKFIYLEDDSTIEISSAKFGSAIGHMSFETFNDELLRKKEESLKTVKIKFHRSLDQKRVFIPIRIPGILEDMEDFIDLTVGGDLDLPADEDLVLPVDPKIADEKRIRANARKVQLRKEKKEKEEKKTQEKKFEADVAASVAEAIAILEEEAAKEQEVSKPIVVEDPLSHKFGDRDLIGGSFFQGPDVDSDDEPEDWDWDVRTCEYVPSRSRIRRKRANMLAPPPPKE